MYYNPIAMKSLLFLIIISTFYINANAQLYPFSAPPPSPIPAPLPSPIPMPSPPIPIPATMPNPPPTPAHLSLIMHVLYSHDLMEICPFLPLEAFISIRMEKRKEMNVSWCS